MAPDVGIDGWRRKPGITVARMAILWVGPAFFFAAVASMGDPSPGEVKQYPGGKVLIVLAGMATYVALLAIPDHLLARRGRPTVVAVHVGFAAFATAVLAALFGVHEWVAVVAGLFLMAMAAALAFAGVVLLNLIAGSFPPSLTQVPDGSASALPSGSAPN